MRPRWPILSPLALRVLPFRSLTGSAPCSRSLCPRRPVLFSRVRKSGHDGELRQAHLAACGQGHYWVQVWRGDRGYVGSSSLRYISQPRCRRCVCILLRRPYSGVLHPGHPLDFTIRGVHGLVFEERAVTGPCGAAGDARRRRGFRGHRIGCGPPAGRRLECLEGSGDCGCTGSCSRPSR